MVGVLSLCKYAEQVERTGCLDSLPFALLYLVPIVIKLYGY
jgi:hypothetical protein